MKEWVKSFLVENGKAAPEQSRDDCLIELGRLFPSNFSRPLLLTLGEILSVLSFSTFLKLYKIPNLIFLEVGPSSAGAVHRLSGWVRPPSATDPLVIVTLRSDIENKPGVLAHEVGHLVMGHHRTDLSAFGSDSDEDFNNAMFKLRFEEELGDVFASWVHGLVWRLPEAGELLDRAEASFQQTKGGGK